MKPTARDRNLIVAASCGALVGAMVALSYAAVPLYNWFCRTTGFAGTTQVATAAPGYQLDRKITVRFDVNVASGLPWRFEPEVTSIDLKLGEVATVIYHVTNLSARDTAGIAGYNVAPLTIGAYFQKINCFCFTEQRLKAGEKQDMTVVFFVDPALAKDAEQDSLDTITLSYTFYPIREPQGGVAQVPASGRS
ncbi:MAG: cytochrome c oxidase assembly protein [Xanthobacteraceae bacterium]|jgi:cytochrome c oxidase assembly protein subunit 11